MSRAVRQISKAVPMSVQPWLPINAAIIATLIGGLLIGFAGTAIAEEVPVITGQSGTTEEGPATAYYRWIDDSGRIQYTDFEPVGVPAQRISLEPEVDDSPVLAAAEERPSDPFHDQDQQILPIEHIGPCADARRQLSILHAALPVYADGSGEYRNAWRGDPYDGERFYLDADTRTDAIALMRRQVLEHCSDPDAFAREEAAFQEELGGQ